MKTKIYTLTLITLSLTLLKAQTTQNRDIKPFTKILASGGAKIYYTQSDTTSLRVKAGDSEIDFVETKVEDNTLYISAKGNYKEGVKIYVFNNKLEDVSLSGAVNIESQNTIKSETLNISLTGASSGDLDVNTVKLSSIQSGASSLKLSGNTDNFSAESSGASSLKAYSLNSKSTAVLTTGASNARVFASEKLVANATGASSIKFKGDAKDVVAEASAASSISKIVDDGSGTSVGTEKNKNNNEDSVVLNIGSKRIIIFDKDPHSKIRIKNKIDEEEFKHWSGLSFGFNGYFSPDGSMSVPTRYKYMDLNYGRSINIQWNIFQHNFNIYHNYVNLVTGFGIEWRRFMFDNKTSLNADSSFTWGSIDTTTTFNFKKNLFRSTMLQVPLLIEFNTNKNPRKSFHVAVGAIGQFMVGGRTKQIYERGGYTFEKVRKDNYNMNPLVLKTHASIGYRSFTAFAEYNITSLFEKGKGPQLYPFVIGVRLIPFN